MHTVNHATGEAAVSPERNVLIESARIARGKIASLADLRVEKYHAVIFPGGTLSKWAGSVWGSNCESS